MSFVMFATWVRGGVLAGVRAGEETVHFPVSIGGQ